jgi:hypothetical protein
MNLMLCCVAPLLVVAPSLTTTSVVVPDTVRTGDARLIALSAHDDPSLADMRGGAPAASALDEVQREALLQAQASTPDLAGMRAGELTNSDLTTIAIVVLVIVVIAIII